ncbi:MAG: hypothetical protein WBG73_24050 [Coleofasciculaceae cyanobacterium]
MYIKQRFVHLLLIFSFTITIACSSHQQLKANANSSAYSYLVKVSDQFNPTKSTALATNEVENTNKSNHNFLVSFATNKSDTDFDKIMSNVAFTYDNAVAALAFISMGDQQRAKLILDAIIYAQNHDRSYQDNRIRNSYRSGELIAPNGQVQLPGWYDNKANLWIEDEFQISTHTGNIAWAMLALLGYYETYGGEPYLTAALKMGEWVQICRDSRGAGGYMGGFSGWEPEPKLLAYKSTEHNIDLYAAFLRLYAITNNIKWQERAKIAQKFVQTMWDDVEGKFWTGTKLDGVSINQDTIPLDVQAWATLVLREDGKKFWRSLDYSEQKHRVGAGFDFNQDRDRIWYEGTAHMAVAYYQTGQTDKAKTLISTLLSAQDASGGIPAVNEDKLTTGFSLPTGEPWFYFKRLHIGATAWMVFAEKKVNPFWIGSKISGTNTTLN